MRPVTQLRIIHDYGALVVLDGNDGVGQVIAARVMELAVERAKEHGIGCVGVRNSNHFGTAAYFTRMAAARGCAAILTTNASPAMAPFGGREKAIGSNPWSLGAPAGEYGTAVLDIANTAVARGKIYAARQAGESIPEGWALDANGRPTTDPAAALADGLILPMGGHKGYAISFMMDVFSGVLTGSSFGTAIVGPYRDDSRSGAGHLAIALDIEKFQPLAQFNSRMGELIAEVKGVPKAPGHDEIYFPGEIEDRNLRGNAAAEIRLPAMTVAELRRLAASCGVPGDALEVVPD
jgi:LDH2 family malate/lactate/ureidoglycolate dehydrogenase